MRRGTMGDHSEEAGCDNGMGHILAAPNDGFKSVEEKDQYFRSCMSVDVFMVGEDSDNELLPTPTAEDMNMQLAPIPRKHISLPLSCTRVHECSRRRLSCSISQRRCSQRRSLRPRNLHQRTILVVLSLLMCLPAAADCLSMECEQPSPLAGAKFPSMVLKPEQEPSQTAQLFEHIAAVERHLESMQALVGSQDRQVKESAKLHAALTRADKCKDLLESVTQSSCFQNCNHLNRENMHSCSFQSNDRSEQDTNSNFVNNFVGQPSEVVTEGICSAAFTGDLRTISALIESGQAPVNVCDYDKRTILHRAVAAGHAEVVRYLLNKGADMYLKDRSGASAFGDAVKSKRAEIREMLKEAEVGGNSEHGAEEREEAGAVPRSHPNNKSALIKRAKNEHWEVHRNEVRILKLIGEGDQGLVYKAEWRGMPVVCKMLKTQGEKSNAEEQLKEFANEISVLAILRHPNLVLFLGACLDWEPNFILTELVEGGSLMDVFERGRQQASTDMRVSEQEDGDGTGPYLPTTAQVVVWATDLARALCCLHQQHPPVIHRDVKPSNLLITQDRHLKLSDLGLSKVMEREGEQGPYHMTGSILRLGIRYAVRCLVLTQRTVMLGATGTLRWMAPEVVRSEDYDAKVDVYSFGFVLWYMCTGELPLDGISQPELVQAAHAGRDIRPDLSRIQCDQAREPKHRPTGSTPLGFDAGAVECLVLTERMLTAHDVLEELAMISPFDPTVTAAKPSA